MAMQLKHEFVIDADPEQVWALLTDVERIAPHVPGGTFDRVDGDEYVGGLSIKVGPVTACFQGSMWFTHKDDATRHAVIAASSRGIDGQADATIHAWVEAITPARTRVLIDTDLDINGRTAQFGRGAFADAGNRLLAQFVVDIAPLLAPPASTATSSVPEAAAADGANIDVQPRVAPVLKERYGQAVAGAVIGFVLSWLAFGRHTIRRRRADEIFWAEAVYRASTGR